MAVPTTGSLFLWAVRRHRLGVLLCGVALGFVIMVLAPAYLATAKAVSGGLATLGAEAQGLAQSFSFLTGPVQRLDTIGGYLSYKILPDVAVVVALYGAIQGCQVLRGAETRGLVELWCAQGCSRSAVVRARLLALFAALSVISLALYAGTVIGGALSQAQLAAGGSTQCLAILLLGIFGAGAGVFVSQFVVSARTAAGAVGGYLVASFFVANLADSLGPLTPLRNLSPFYYYIQNRTLVPGISVDVAALVVLLLAAAALTAAGWVLFLRRDLGGVVLQRLQRARSAVYVLRRSRFWHRRVWLALLWEQRLGLICWTVGLALFAAVEAAVAPSAVSLLRSGGGTLGRSLATHGFALTADSFLSAFISVDAILVGAFAVTQVSRWAGDATHHRTDALLIQPMSMARLLTERMISFAAACALISSATMVALWVGAVIGGYSVGADRLARTAADFMLLGFSVGGVGLAFVTVARSGAATAGLGGALAGCFCLTVLAGVLNWPAWTTNISVFGSFGSPYLGWPSVGATLYLGALGLAGCGAAYAAMRGGMRVAA